MFKGEAVPTKVHDLNEQEEEELKILKQKLRVSNMMDKVETKFFAMKVEEAGKSIVKVNNKVLSLDKSKNQTEIYKGRYTLNINKKMPTDI